jgi:hypothetical protein
LSHGHGPAETGHEQRFHEGMMPKQGGVRQV